MIILKATLYPHGSEAESYDIMHGTITNIGKQMGCCDYFVHLMARPDGRRGIDGFEKDIRVNGWNSSLTLPSMLGVILGTVCPVPLDHEPIVREVRRLEIHDANEFERRMERNAA